MKNILSVLLIISALGVIHGQSFEGKLTYKASFELNEQLSKMYGLSKEDVMKKMKTKGEVYDEVTVFIKDGNYSKLLAGEKKKRHIYKSDKNLIYHLEEGIEDVLVVNGNNVGLMDLGVDDQSIIILEVDSTKVILGDTCKAIKVDWGGMSEEWYWYSEKKLKINPELFKKHKHVNLDKILAISNSYPMEISKSQTMPSMIRVQIRHLPMPTFRG